MQPPITHLEMTISPIPRAIEAARRFARLTWPRWASQLPGIASGANVVPNLTVSLTSHGSRVETVFAAIYSILRGRFVPESLVLVLNDSPRTTSARRTLDALVRHGLRIMVAPNFGPHTKYYPLVSGALPAGERLVTADDDIFYRRDWLERLVRVHEAHPGDVVAWWAKSMRMDGLTLRSYHDWPNVADCEGRPFHFALGVAGVLYPNPMVLALRDAGSTFADCCPKADDIWLHAIALRSRHSVRQVTADVQWPIHIPGTQEAGLKNFNHRPEGNDLQIRATYRPEDLAALRVAIDHSD
jgi:hypothetical protein